MNTERFNCLRILNIENDLSIYENQEDIDTKYIIKNRNTYALSLFIIR